MKEYLFTTKEPIATNEVTMDVFLDSHFYNVFDSEAVIKVMDGTYSEVIDGNGKIWGLHASGDGDFVSHKIRFEAIN